MTTTTVQKIGTNKAVSIPMATKNSQEDKGNKVIEDPSSLGLTIVSLNYILGSFIFMAGSIAYTYDAMIKSHAYKKEGLGYTIGSILFVIGCGFFIMDAFGVNSCAPKVRFPKRNLKGGENKCQFDDSDSSFDTKCKNLEQRTKPVVVPVNDRVIIRVGDWGVVT